jgi:hypothetical protein
MRRARKTTGATTMTRTTGGALPRMITSRRATARAASDLNAHVEQLDKGVFVCVGGSEQGQGPQPRQNGRSAGGVHCTGQLAWGTGRTCSRQRPQRAERVPSVAAHGPHGPGVAQQLGPPHPRQCRRCFGGRVCAAAAASGWGTGFARRGWTKRGRPWGAGWLAQKCASSRQKGPLPWPRGAALGARPWGAWGVALWRGPGRLRAWPWGA